MSCVVNYTWNYFEWNYILVQYVYGYIVITDMCVFNGTPNLCELFRLLRTGDINMLIGITKLNDMTSICVCH